MDGRITHGIRYLCKIQALVPDQLLGGVDFHPGKIIDDAAAVFFTEELLQLGTSHQVVPADLFNRQLCINMKLQVIHYPFIKIHIGFLFQCGRTLKLRFYCRIMADQLN